MNETVKVFVLLADKLNCVTSYVWLFVSIRVWQGKKLVMRLLTAKFHEILVEFQQ